MARSTSKLHQDAGYMSELRFRSLNSLDGGEASIYAQCVTPNVSRPMCHARQGSKCVCSDSGQVSNAEDHLLSDTSLHSS